MEWAEAVTDDEGRLKLPDGWLPSEYYDALNVLFRVENALRVFAYVVLKNAHGEKWLDVSLKSDDLSSGTIASVARQREEQDKKHGYLGRDVSSPLMYLTSGEVIRLMLSDGEWPHFAGYFVAARELIRSKLEEIGNIRNALAHFRPLTKEDVQLVKVNAKHVLGLAEQAVGQVLNCSQVVPTNTAEEWYGAISRANATPLEVAMHQSEDGRWIALKAKFDCEIVRPSVEGATYMNPGVLVLDTGAILKEFGALRGYLTCLSEETPSKHVRGPNDARFSKRIVLTLSRVVLQRSHAEVVELLAKLRKRVADEAELIRQDNLARGTLVRVATVVGRKDKIGDKSYWICGVDPLKCPQSAGDGSEYWGPSPKLAVGNWVSGARDYPWIPGGLSLIVDTADIPF